MAETIGGDERLAGIQQVWTEGDYRRIAELFAPVSERLATELDVAGRRVLDAATGTGNTAIAMARAGAEVDAFDLTPSMLDRARERAVVEHVEVDFREADLDWDAIRTDLVCDWDEAAAPTAAGIELPSTYAVASVDRRS